MPSVYICLRMDRRDLSSTYRLKYFFKAYRIMPAATMDRGNLMWAEISYSINCIKKAKRNMKATVPTNK